MKFSRRDFLGASVAASAFGLGAVFSFPDAAVADGKDHKPGMTEFPSLFLTWQRDPTTTMLIQWVGEEDDNHRTIDYVSTKGKIWKTAKVLTKPFPGTDLKVHRCELSGLEPGTDYRFQVAGVSPEYRFRTMPEKATDEFRFISGGDAGTNSEAVESNRIAALQDPYFVLMGGDLAYDNGRSPRTFLKFLENYHETMVDSSGRLIPMIACVGNHEVDGGYVHDDRTRAGSFLSVFDGFYPETSYGVLDIGDYLSLVLVDTNHLSPIQGEQTDWLETTLKQRQDHPHVFVAGHVPCYPSVRSYDGKISEIMREQWCPLYERYGVNVVLEHHDHTFKRTHPLLDGMTDSNGVHYLGDGSWGKLRTPASLDERPYLAKVSETYHVTLHQLQGDLRMHVALTDEGRVADVTATRSKRAAR